MDYKIYEGPAWEILLPVLAMIVIPAVYSLVTRFMRRARK